MAGLNGYESLEGGVAGPRGFVAGGLAADIKASGKPDLAGVLSEAGPCTVAGMFTTNVVKAPSVRFNQAITGRGRAQAIVCNSGNANACTGPQGYEDTRRMAELMAARTGVPPGMVLVCSTGVIGRPLPMAKIERGIQALELSAGGGPDAARAIMTTDTFPKFAALEVGLGGGRVRIGGMCKGAGMIHPNMATMLAFFTTDAAIEAASLGRLLKGVVDQSFNMISVDGDSSTNDTVLILANGASGVNLSDGTPETEEFGRAFATLAQGLAREIVRGAEGATKVFRVDVSGAATEADARLIARSVTSSNLFKAAVHGADPNWGRILCAAGYSGAHFDPDRVDVAIGPAKVFVAGVPAEFAEKAVSDYLRGSESVITIDLHAGSATASAWGCDLSKEYVEINADYTT